ncbi:hypothetical protein EVAR_68616_1 [Eumeta japonica]|uniref:Uncharacterized protein n=1 Tax=Eumeta variegata TaxID=151549 RepID=A0A4C2ACK5_EUMVA|nr:hypothetical protein EVAR_68616_1 [Eumeta japonica]
MSKEGRLTRVGVLAPAALSACMDASVLAVPAASAIVSTVLKELSKAFMLKKWSSPLMDTPIPRGITSALPASWVGTGYKMERRFKNEEEGGGRTLPLNDTACATGVRARRVRERKDLLRVVRELQGYERVATAAGLTHRC